MWDSSLLCGVVLSLWIGKRWSDVVPAVADEDGEGVVCEALHVARLQAHQPARDARSQLALRDRAVERDQELRDGHTGLGPAEKVLVREERREVAEHVRQDLPVLFFAHDVDDREQE